MRFVKYGWLLFALMALLNLTGCEQDQTVGTGGSVNSARIGGPAPDFTLTDLQGQKVTLSQFRGKVVLLNFWATWCPPCVEEMPSMEQLHNLFKDQGLVLLAVNIEEDGAKTVPHFQRGKNFSFPILLDLAAEVQNRYGVFRFPETFIVDRNGNLVDRLIGGRNWMADTLLKRINFLLNG